jgi:hypothetical protein
MARFTEKQSLQIKKDRDRKRKSGSKNASLTTVYDRGKTPTRVYRNDGDPTHYEKNKGSSKKTVKAKGKKYAKPLDDKNSIARRYVKKGDRRDVTLKHVMNAGGKNNGSKKMLDSPTKTAKWRSDLDKTINKESEKEYQRKKRKKNASLGSKGMLGASAKERKEYYKKESKYYRREKE